MCVQRLFFVRTTPIYFVRTTPIFRPEMIFSYFTPKLQLLADSAPGLLGSTTKN